MLKMIGGNYYWFFAYLLVSFSMTLSEDFSDTKEYNLSGACGAERSTRGAENNNQVSCFIVPYLL